MVSTSCPTRNIEAHLQLRWFYQDKHFQFLRRGFLDGERPASLQMNTDDDSSTSNDRQGSDDMQGLELTEPDSTNLPIEPEVASHQIRQIETDDVSDQVESDDDSASIQSDSDSNSSHGDPRPPRARRPVDKPMSQADKQRVKENIRRYFNQMLVEERKESVEALYDPSKKIFKARIVYRNGRTFSRVENAEVRKT